MGSPISVSGQAWKAYQTATTGDVRPLTIRYPSGRYLRLNYGSSGGLNDQMRRISALIDDDNSTHLADYSYLGFDRTIEAGYAASAFKMTLLKQTGDGTLPSSIDPGDKYTGVDRMQRIWDMRWIRNSDSTFHAVLNWKKNFINGKNRHSPW